ncbi:MAG: hypothetical protein GWP08_20880 [Nitrospiraceae bacterium]|nr:hypothetical protein [Nitrospiraceae bacterium]
MSDRTARPAAASRRFRILRVVSARLEDDVPAVLGGGALVRLRTLARDRPWARARGRFRVRVDAAFADGGLSPCAPSGDTTILASAMTIHAGRTAGDRAIHARDTAPTAASIKRISRMDVLGVCNMENAPSDTAD